MRQCSLAGDCSKLEEGEEGEGGREVYADGGDSSTGRWHIDRQIHLRKCAGTDRGSKYWDENTDIMDIDTPQPLPKDKTTSCAGSPTSKSRNMMPTPVSTTWAFVVHEIACSGP